MGIERVRVAEVHAPTSLSQRTGSGFLVSDRLVLTAAAVAGRDGPTHVRPVGAGSWMAASVVWRAARGGAALLEIDGDPALISPPPLPRWGEVGGRRPVGVMAVGFPPADGRPQWPRDPEPFLGQVTPPDDRRAPDDPLLVTAGPGARPVGDGMSGAALFAGAHLVGVLLVEGGPAGPLRLAAAPVAAMAADGGFVALVGDGEDLPVEPVSTLVGGFPILHSR
jgi:hypothetical protein